MSNTHKAKKSVGHWLLLLTHMPTAPVQLVTFFRRKEEEMIRSGDIQGLLLSGIGTPESMRLLQTFLDKTGDIQTVSLVAVHALHGSGEATDKRCLQWIEMFCFSFLTFFVRCVFLLSLSLLCFLCVCPFLSCCFSRV